MEMHQVRYFLAVAQALNFTRAAEECHVAQPSLTRAIRQLEGELGGDLFRRERPHAQLTELGQRMLPLLRQCFESALGARSLAAAVKRGEVGSLRLALSQTIDQSVVMPHVIELGKLFHGLELKLLRGTAFEVIDFLKRGDAELGLGAAIGDEWERLDRWPLFAEGFQLIVKSTHPIASQSAVGLDDLRQERLVVRTCCETTPQLLEVLRGRGFDVNRRHEVGAESDLIALLEAGVGIAFLPRSTTSPATSPSGRARAQPDRLPLWCCRPAAHGGGGDADEDAARLRLVALCDLMRRLERREKILNRHAPTVVRIDEARFDPPVRAHDEGRGDRKHPGIAPLKTRYVPAGPCHELLYLCPNPERQIQGERIAVVDVGQNRKGRLGFRFELCCELLAVRHDCDDLSPVRHNFFLRLRQGRRVDAAIRAPMPAVEGDGHRALLQHIIEAYQLTGLVGQDEGRHRLTGPRRRLAHIMLLEPRHQLVHGALKCRVTRPHRIGEGLQPFRQRCIHVAGPGEGLFEGIREWFRHAQAPRVITAVCQPAKNLDSSMLRNVSHQVPPVSPDTTHQFWRMERREFGFGHVLLQRYAN